MASFSKPAQGQDTQLPAKRKRTLAPKITDQDNIDKDAVKRRKQAQPAQPKNVAKPTESTHTTASTSKSQQQSARGPSNRQPSVEEIDDDEANPHHNAGPPRNPNAILERSDGSDDPDETDKECEREDEGSALQEETDEEELGD